MIDSEELHKALNTPAHRLIDKYMKLTRVHRNVTERELSITGVYRSQHQLLMYVARNPNMSQKELAGIYGVSAATIAVSLKKLEKGGYISRNVDKGDKRYNQIHITEKGRQVVKESFRIFQELERNVCDGFSQEDYEKMGELLDKMYHNMEIHYLKSQDRKRGLVSETL